MGAFDGALHPCGTAAATVSNVLFHNKKGHPFGCPFRVKRGQKRSGKTILWSNICKILIRLAAISEANHDKLRVLGQKGSNPVAVGAVEIPRIVKELET